MSKDYSLYIFDLDGTLVSTSSGATFRKSAEDWVWLPRRIIKSHELLGQGAKLAIATNQGGVAFGHLPADAIAIEVNRAAMLFGASVAKMCFHHPSATIQEFCCDCPYRKPKPGMLLGIMHDLNVLPVHTLYVGDRPEDEQAAKNAGVAFQWAWQFFGNPEPEGEHS